MAGHTSYPHEPPRPVRRVGTFEAPGEAPSEALRVEPLGGADSVPITSRTSTHAEMEREMHRALSSTPPPVVVEQRVAHERMHQPLARRMGLWFVALSGIVLAALFYFSLAAGWTLPEIVFLAAYGLIVGLTMVLVPGPKVSDTERAMAMPNRGGVWGRLDRTRKAIWIAAMIVGIPLAGVIAWTMSELAMGVD